MIVSCPSCGTGYLLPEHLVGPGGASVRCPRCHELFSVDAKGLPKEPPGARAGEPPLGAAAEPPAELHESAGPPEPTGDGPHEPAADGPLAVARDVLERLARERGEAIEQARDGQRLFAEFGPALMEAFEAYRREAGAEAGPGPFRQALRERWGVELVPLAAPGD